MVPAALLRFRVISHSKFESECVSPRHTHTHRSPASARPHLHHLLDTRFSAAFFLFPALSSAHFYGAVPSCAARAARAASASWYRARGGAGGAGRVRGASDAARTTRRRSGGRAWASLPRPCHHGPRGDQVGQPAARPRGGVVDGHLYAAKTKSKVCLRAAGDAAAAAHPLRRASKYFFEIYYSFTAVDAVLLATAALPRRPLGLQGPHRPRWCRAAHQVNAVAPGAPP